MGQDLQSDSGERKISFGIGGAGNIRMDDVVDPFELPGKANRSFTGRRSEAKVPDTLLETDGISLRRGSTWSIRSTTSLSKLSIFGKFRRRSSRDDAREMPPLSTESSNASLESRVPESDSS